MQWLLITLLTTYYQQFVYSIEETANLVMTADKPAESEVYQRRQFCHWPCKCSHKRSCPLGVSLVKDGCGCCKICAKQLGKSCNEAEVCDHHRGLYCDYSADAPKYEVGICKYIFAVGCELNGVLYQNGQSFQPSPFYTCLCISDTIGCTPIPNSKQSDSHCTDATGLVKKKSDLANCALEKNPDTTDYKFIPDYLAFNPLPALTALHPCLPFSVKHFTPCLEKKVSCAGNWLESML
ncbi:cellular communication network factor 6 [Anomaloglossus baeobatrachus]